MRKKRKKELRTSFAKVTRAAKQLIKRRRAGNNPKTFHSMFVKRVFVTKGKSGGLKWLLTKHRAMESFGIGWHGKYEDWKTLFWWKRKLRALPALKPLVVTTTRAYNEPAKLSNRILEPFVGGLIILAEKYNI